MDGSSHSIGIDEDGFHVTGHNYEYADDGKSAFYNLVNERGFKEKLEAYVKNHSLRTMTIQGELCAPGIQQNRLKLLKPEWYVFTIREDGTLKLALVKLAVHSRRFLTFSIRPLNKSLSKSFLCSTISSVEHSK